MKDMFLKKEKQETIEDIKNNKIAIYNQYMA